MSSLNEMIGVGRRMDLDVVPYRNPLPYLIGLSADVAVPNSACAATNDAEPLRVGERLEQDTGLLYADANPRALRFVYDWLRVQRHYRCAAPPPRALPCACMLRPHTALRPGIGRACDVQGGAPMGQWCHAWQIYIDTTIR